MGFDQRHKHAQGLILADGLPGFSRRETMLVALVVRFSAKGTPDGAELGSLARADDPKRLPVLAGVLRLAEQLDRTRSRRVAAVTVVADRDEVVVRTQHDGSAEVELRAARRGADLLAAALGRPVNTV